MQKLVRLIGNDEARVFVADKAKRKVAQDQAKLAADQKASPAKKSHRNHFGIGRVNGRLAPPLSPHQVQGNLNHLAQRCGS